MTDPRLSPSTPASPGRARSSPLRWFVAGAAAALAVLVLVLLFVAYQKPELLLDWVNLRYCG